MGTRLGQNFLKNEEVVKRIINSAHLTAEDLVLEIGPGKGILTEELAKVCKKVIAVELDEKLVEFLGNKFKDNKNVEIVEKDILKIRPKDLYAKYNIQDTKYKVIANLPYYITSPIIRMFLEAELKPSEMILMVQKEVAERIVARPGRHSILSLSVQYYAEPEIMFCVEKNNFEPVPEVDSAVISISISNEKKLANKEKTDNFFRVVRAGFCAKRKTLANNLSNSFHLKKGEVEKKLKSFGILEKSRAQELTLGQWEKLTNLLDKK